MGWVCGDNHKHLQIIYFRKYRNILVFIFVVLKSGKNQFVKYNLQIFEGCYYFERLIYSIICQNFYYWNHILTKRAAVILWEQCFDVWDQNVEMEFSLNVFVNAYGGKCANVG